MKRGFIAFFMVALVLLTVFASLSWGAWTITSRIKGSAGKYKIWEVGLTGDNAEMTATSLDVPRGLTGDTLMVMTVVPGAGGVAPDAAFNITLSNEFMTLWSDTSISHTAQTNHSLADDLNQYPTIFGDLKLAVSDIGASGDQITLYFLIWEE